MFWEQLWRVQRFSLNCGFCLTFHRLKKKLTLVSSLWVPHFLRLPLISFIQYLKWSIPQLLPWWTWDLPLRSFLFWLISNWETHFGSFHFPIIFSSLTQNPVRSTTIWTAPLFSAGSLNANKWSSCQKNYRNRHKSLLRR